MSQFSCSKFAGLVSVAAMFWATTLSHGAIITAGPVTNLSNTLFLNNASTSGGDTNATAVAVTTTRTLDLNGAAGAPGQTGTLKFSGFAFASAANIPTPLASTLKITLTYLGANGTAGGGDDVVVGTTDSFTFDDGISGNGAGFEAASVYYVNFDSAPSAVIDGLNENFNLTITPAGGSVRFKTTSGTALSAAKFTVAGTFVVPEPTSLAALAGLCVLARRRRN